MSAWATAAAAVAALILYLVKLWAQQREANSPEKKELERHETTQQRRQAAATGDADYLAADIDRLRERAKRRLSERLVEAGAAESGGDGAD